MPEITRRSFHIFAGSLAMAAILPRAVLAQEPAQGGSLTLAVTNEPPGLVPLTTTAASTVIIGPKIVEGLLTYDFDLSPRPQLATAWDVSEDGLTYTFTLREGVSWHDGAPFTAEDVVYSLETIKAHHPRGQSTFQNMTSVEAVDPQTVVLHLSEPAPYLLTAFAAGETPIVPKHVYEASGSDPASSPADAAPIGTGPFRFVEWARGSHVLLERNPDYWDAPKPYLDEVIIRFVTDASVRAVGLEAGEIDLAGWTPVPLTDMDRISANPMLEVETRGNEYQNNQFYRIEFNLENPYFSDLRVRQAVAHVVDRQTVLDLVFLGYGELAPSVITPSLTQIFNPDVPVYPLDADKANALLDEAGYTRDGAGKRFEVTMDARPGFATQIAQYVKNALAPLGIDVTVRNEDLSAYVRRIYTDRQFDFNAQASSQLFDPIVGTQRFYWSKNFRPGVPYSNAAAYQSPEADAALEAASIENDPAARRAQLFEFQRIVATDLPAIPLVAQSQITIANRRVANHTTTADGVSANFADVYIQPN